MNWSGRRNAYVQIWNLDIQRQLPGNVQLNVGYNGAKGTRLDTERALVPSCGATDSCAAASNEAAAPFIYESSEGNSILHAGSVRVRKRMSKGLGISASYVFSKSIDDASSIGGGGTVVVQNPFYLPGDRGLSSFDARHNLNLQLQYSSGTGLAGGTLLNGWRGALVKDWTLLRDMREQTLGVEPWCAAALLLEVLRRAAQHLAEQRRHAPAASSDSRLSSPWSASVNSSRSPLRT
jgi:hypothetical protein